MRPWQGKIHFLGEAIMGKTPEQIVRLGISLVPEGRDIFPSLTVEENLRLGAFTRKDRGEYRRNLDENLRAVPDAERTPRNSPGARYRAASSSNWRSPAP